MFSKKNKYFNFRSLWTRFVLQDKVLVDGVVVTITGSS